MFLELCIAALPSFAQDAVPPPTEKPKISVEEEVLANLKALEIAPIHVEDLALPDDFLKRVSDRIIRSSYEDRYRIVVPDPKPGEGGQRAVLAPPPADAQSTPAWKRPLVVGAALLGALFMGLGILMSRRRRRGAA